MSDEHAVQHESHLPVYKKVIVALAVMTAVEFAIAFAIQGVSGAGFVLGVLGLLGLAFWKAWLVARYFMHLKYDPKILAVAAITPLILAAPLCIFVIWDATAGPGF